MNAILQPLFSRWPLFPEPGTVLGMVNHADTSTTASRIRAAQQERLARLRQIMEPVQADAARRAGVSFHAWSRMETGKSTVDAVALARWCEAHNLPADYVILGRLDGLPDPVKRAVIAAEAEAERRSGAQPHSGEPAIPPPKRSRGRPRRIAGTAPA
jgi:transcriptional regulator with XRE-family HTH domain